MASRQRFRIPTSREIKGDQSGEVKQYSLFKNYQQNKGKGDNVSELKSSSGDQREHIPNTGITTKASTVQAARSSSSSSSSTAAAVGKPVVAKSSAVPTAKSEGTTLASNSVPLSTTSSKTSSDSVPAPVTSSKPASSNSIIVNYRQRGNPILKHIRNVPWEFGSIVPDYVMGVANCALFLSLRYHQLHPEYLHNRLKELGKGYDLRVLLVQVDVKDPHHQLKDLAKICILADLTLILAFSPEEAGRYLEAYKVYENKPAEVLMEKTDTDYSSKLTECLTTVKSVNKTDSMTLLSAFKSMEGIINASKEDISLCAGFGPQKAQRLYDVFHEPFVKGRKRPKDMASDSSQASSPKKKQP